MLVYIPKHRKCPQWYSFTLRKKALSLHSYLHTESIWPGREALQGVGVTVTAVATLQMPPGGLPNLPGLLAAQTGAGARPPGSAT